MISVSELMSYILFFSIMVLAVFVIILCFIDEFQKEKKVDQVMTLESPQELIEQEQYSYEDDPNDTDGYRLNVEINGIDADTGEYKTFRLHEKRKIETGKTVENKEKKGGR